MEVKSNPSLPCYLIRHKSVPFPIFLLVLSVKHWLDSFATPSSHSFESMFGSVGKRTSNGCWSCQWNEVCRSNLCWMDWTQWEVTERENDYFSWSNEKRTSHFRLPFFSSCHVVSGFQRDLFTCTIVSSSSINVSFSLTLTSTFSRP